MWKTFLQLGNICGKIYVLRWEKSHFLNIKILFYTFLNTAKTLATSGFFEFFTKFSTPCGKLFLHLEKTFHVCGIYGRESCSRLYAQSERASSRSPYTKPRIFTRQVWNSRMSDLTSCSNVASTSISFSTTSMEDIIVVWSRPKIFAMLCSDISVALRIT